MEKIASFRVDHEKLEKGIYVSREDGDILTCDLRMCAPYKDAILTNVQLHSLEHALATAMRNSKIKDNIVYVGPMGCQTGFYVLLKQTEKPDALAVIKQAFEFVAHSRQLSEMPGSTTKECGNCLTLSLKAARETAAAYYNVIKNKTEFDVYC